MCDTLSILSSWTGNKNGAFFAKNSDREPGEKQIVQAVSGESLSLNDAEKTVHSNEKQGYIETNFSNLKKYLTDQLKSNRKERLSAVISRPDWLWGAEIGVNERGVSIGNEAVFPKIKPLKTAILGMDILRLALQLSPNALEAKNFICEITAKYGQAGDGGYRHKSVYHNSFLIQDKDEAYAVETAGNRWISRKIKDYCTISNTYLKKGECRETETEYSAGMEPGLDVFKGRYESKIYNFFAKGEARNRYKNAVLAGLKGNTDLESIKSLMRSHVGQQHVHRSDRRSIQRGMRSICIHSGRLIKSETTASMIVHYIGDKFIVWYTGSSFPCVSIYKPLIVSKECADVLNLEDIDLAQEVHERRQELAVKLERNYSRFLEIIKPIRDDYERRFKEIIYSGIEKKSDSKLCDDIVKCHKLENEYLKQVSL